MTVAPRGEPGVVVEIEYWETRPPGIPCECGSRVSWFARDAFGHNLTFGCVNCHEPPAIEARP
jgi:hypothetical protein